MPEATARKKFSCPACGAAAEWNPGEQSLVCPFCGTTSPAQVELNAAGEALSHLRRLLKLTDLTAIQWIYLNHARIEFTTITR